VAVHGPAAGAGTGAPAAAPAIGPIVIGGPGRQGVPAAAQEAAGGAEGRGRDRW
jgi:hypothetical protein